MGKQNEQNLLSIRYAEALFDLAKDKKKLSDVQNDLDDLAKSLDASEEMEHIINSPNIKDDQLVTIAEQISKKAKLNPLTANFVKLLATNRRLAILHSVSRAFNELVMAEQNASLARVTVASAMTKTQKTKLEKTLSDATKRDITIEEIVDPEILGGLVVRIGSKMVDASIAGKLESLRLELINPQAA